MNPNLASALEVPPDPMKYWLQGYGDWASVLGVIVSVAGFVFAWQQLVKTRTAAEAAEAAAESAQRRMGAFVSVTDVATAIQLLERLRAHHRENNWSAALDGYAQTRKYLIAIRSRGSLMDEQRRNVLASAIANLKNMEEAVEAASMDGGATKDRGNFNRILSDQIDDLVELLEAMKVASAHG